MDVSSLSEPERSLENGKIKVRLICPVEEILTTEADKVLLPAQGGDILILPNRAPLFLYLRAGRMIIYNEGKPPVSYFISKGVCEVRRNLCPVLAWGIKEDAVQLDLVQKNLAESQEMLEKYGHHKNQQEMMNRIDFFQMILRMNSKQQTKKYP